MPVTETLGEIYIQDCNPDGTYPESECPEQPGPFENGEFEVDRVSMTSVAGVVKVYWKGWGEYTLELRKHMSNSKEAVNEAVDRYNKGIFLLFIYLRARN